MWLQRKNKLFIKFFSSSADCISNQFVVLFVWRQGRHWSNGVSWYPSYQKIFELTQNFWWNYWLYCKFWYFLWTWISVPISKIFSAILIMLGWNRSSFHFELAAVGFQSFLWLPIAAKKIHKRFRDHRTFGEKNWPKTQDTRKAKIISRSAIKSKSQIAYPRFIKKKQFVPVVDFNFYY